MLYPKIRDIEKSNKEIRFLAILSIAISLICLLINYLVTKKFGWSIVAIASIIYLWVTIRYSVLCNFNIASHTMIQTISISVLIIIIDIIFGKIGWSFIIGVPIILLLSNIIMLIVTLLKNKKYAIYAIYESVIFIFSLATNLALIIIFKNRNMILNWVSLIFSLYNLSIVLAINGKVMIEEWKRRLHV